MTVSALLLLQGALRGTRFFASRGTKDRTDRVRPDTRDLAPVPVRTARPRGRHQTR